MMDITLRSRNGCGCGMGERWQMNEANAIAALDVESGEILAGIGGML